MKKIVFGMTAVLAAAVLAGCFSTAAPVTTDMVLQNWGSFGEITRIPVKDFESKGLVFTEMEFQITPQGTVRGEVFTYQALLKEAQKLGADTIINIVIDKQTEAEAASTGTGSAVTIKEKWFGSALAIKYTEALTQDYLLTDGPAHGTSGGQVRSGRASSASDASPKDSKNAVGF